MVKLLSESMERELDKIRKRLNDYRKYRNDSFAYNHDEIKEVREFKDHAYRDIAFLLDLIDELKR